MSVPTEREVRQSSNYWLRWNQTIFKVPSNPNHSMILWYPLPSVLQQLWTLGKTREDRPWEVARVKGFLTAVPPVAAVRDTTSGYAGALSWSNRAFPMQ